MRVQSHFIDLLFVFFFRILLIENTVRRFAQIGTTETISASETVAGKPHIARINAHDAKVTLIAVLKPECFVASLAVIDMGIVDAVATDIDCVSVRRIFCRI